MAQRQPTPQQINAAQRILANNHKHVYALHSKGATIRALQIALASQGYEPGRFDGDWGEKTQAAYDKYMADHDQTGGSATPKKLAFMSGQIGQPLPRQRPEPGGTFIGGNGAMPEPAPEPMAAPPAPATREFTPPVAPMPAAPSPSQSAEREYDPNIMHAAVMNRNEPADMRPDYAPPVMSPPPMGPGMADTQPPVDPSFWGSVGDATAIAAGEQPTMGPAIAAAQHQAPHGFDPSRFDAASEPATSDTGVPDNLVENMGARQAPMTLRDALIQSGQFPASNQRDILESLKRALLAAQPQMAGY